MRRAKKALWAIIAVGMTASGCKKRQDRPDPDHTAGKHAAEALQPDRGGAAATKPTRIILMIGDGMGVPEVTAASYAKGSPLEMLDMAQMGLMTTHSHEFVTTDSAASATALATGHKTHYEGISVKPATTADNETDASRHYQTTLEKAEKAGWRTGLVSTVRVVHATPAAFGAHRANRHSYEGIAADMYDSGVDVLLGGGPSFFRDRSDGRNLVEGFEKKGYKVGFDKQHIDAASKLTDKLVGFPHDPDFPGAGDPRRAMTLAEMTHDALDVLDRDNDAGFFLMVEGSQIDWRAHSLDGAGMVREMLDFDAAVAEARAYARKRDDTLVVVTGDHETGGLSVVDAAQAGRLRDELGGADKVAEMTDWPASAGAKAPAETAASVDMGQQDGADQPHLRPPFARSDSFATVFGQLSVASRALCETPGEFRGLHTPSFIPIFADGKAARYVAKADDNAELGRRIGSLVGNRAGEGDAGEMAEPAGVVGSQPDNVIVMVADHLGIAALTAAYYGHGPLAMRSMPVTGLAATHAANRLVSDSAAASSALATGRLADVGSVGVARTDHGLARATTLLERAERQHKASGIVTTGRWQAPEVAAFYAHSDAGGGPPDDAVADFVELGDRSEQSDGIDFVFGHQTQPIEPKHLSRLRQTGLDIRSDWPADATLVQMSRATDPTPKKPPTSGDDRFVPSFEQMTRRALDALDDSGQGFALVAVAGRDGADIGADGGKSLVDDVVAFDAAVAAAVSFARRDGHTLVVVVGGPDDTASVIDNHYGFDGCSCAAARACGGPDQLHAFGAAVDAVDHHQGLSDRGLQGTYAPPKIAVQYAWLAQHGPARGGRAELGSANFVPIFAFGPGARLFEGFHGVDAVGRGLADAVDSSK